MYRKHIIGFKVKDEAEDLFLDTEIDLKSIFKCDLIIPGVRAVPYPTIASKFIKVNDFSKLTFDKEAILDDCIITSVRYDCLDDTRENIVTNTVRTGTTSLLDGKGNLVIGVYTEALWEYLFTLEISLATNVMTLVSNTSFGNIRFTGFNCWLNNDPIEFPPTSSVGYEYIQVPNYDPVALVTEETAEITIPWIRIYTGVERKQNDYIGLIEHSWLSRGPKYRYVDLHPSEVLYKIQYKGKKVANEVYHIPYTVIHF